jgi:hypothetical protein
MRGRYQTGRDALGLCPICGSPLIAEVDHLGDGDLTGLAECEDPMCSHFEQIEI